MAFDASLLHAAVAAVCPIDGVSVGDPANKATWAVQFQAAATAAQRTAAQNAITSFDPATALVPLITLDLIQTRMEAEGVWDTYVNYMFGTNARRNAFMKTMFVGLPLRQDNAAFRTSMTGAGIAAAVQDRILATP